MIASMTAFSRKTTHSDHGQMTWEVRTVNHRYLEVAFKIPDFFREYEPSWKKIVSTFMQRGKVDCYLTFTPGAQMQPCFSLNVSAVEQLLTICQSLMQYPGVSTKLKPTELLQFEAVLRSTPPEVSNLALPLSDLLKTTLSELVQARVREGEALRVFIQEKLRQMFMHVQVINERKVDSVKAQEQKLLSRMEALNVPVTEDRLEQALLFYVQRVDIEEEIERLLTHIEEAHRILLAGGVMGRRLDFLVQEMAREANTLASKALDKTITQSTIELKVLIEQIREQVQNVE